MFHNVDWRIIDKPGFESWYFYANVSSDYSLETLSAWLKANLPCYEANTLESYDQTYNSIYIRLNSADDAALFKLAWC